MRTREREEHGCAAHPGHISYDALPAVLANCGRNAFLGRHTQDGHLRPSLMLA
jgi:hypothetical protein